MKDVPLSSLSHILSVNADSLRAALADWLRRTTEPILESHDDGLAAFDALLAYLERGDANKAEAWARSARVAASDDFRKVLGTLACVERVLRLFVVKIASERKDILAKLERVADGVDFLRRCAIDAVLREQVGESAVGDGLVPGEAFRDLVEHGLDIVCLTNPQGKPIYLNRAGRRLLRAEADGPVPITSLRDYMTDETWAELRDAGVPAVKRSGHWEGRGQLKSARSSEPVDVHTAAFLVRKGGDDEKSLLALVHRDYGHESQLEELLEESDARKHAILESSLDPIITIDHRGVVTEFNRAAEQVFGRKRAEVLGTKPSEILFPPSKTAGHQNRIDRYLNAGEGSLLSKRTEVIAVRSSGLPFEAELTMTINQERGMPVLTFFVRDISARKRAEEEQRRYAQDLERSNRELEQFAYVASHDLQEPLRKIRTFGDRLQTQCGDALDDMGRECIARMKNAAERMQALINGLLTLSRVTTKATDFSTVNLTKIAREVAGDLEVKIAQSGGKVEIGRLPTIQADSLQMRQLLQNLMGNALKFHKEGVAPLVEVKGSLLNVGDRLPSGDF
ncbi:MAG: PAS domain S-box protein, partial [Pirellulaceae bacterium]|nr:PAS domain S-box protein [Pirellulaceae bacterium]